MGWMKTSAWLLAGLMAMPAVAEDLTREEEATLREMRKAAKAQGYTLTPELEKMALDTARRMQAQALGLQAAANAMHAAAASGAEVAAPMSAPSVAAPPPSSREPQPAASLVLPPKEDARVTHFEDLADGFKANGQPWLDPEGQIDLYAANPATGEVTYLVAQGAGRFLVKHANVNSTLGPVTVGQLAKLQGRQEYEGVDGQRLAATSFILTGRGLLGYRPGALFHLEFGQPSKPYSMPEGFQVSPWQTGDVSGTGYVLLYRRHVDDGSIGSFIKSTKATFGKNTDADVMFFNLHTGKTVPTGVSGHKIHDGPNRYDDMRLRDNQHIYWRARWYSSAAGPIAMVREDGPARLAVINLDTGARAIAFERRAGLGDWELAPTQDGKLHFRGSWAFKKHEIEDVAALLTP